MEIFTTVFDLPPVLVVWLVDLEDTVNEMLEQNRDYLPGSKYLKVSRKTLIIHFTL